MPPALLVMESLKPQLHIVKGLGLREKSVSSWTDSGSSVVESRVQRVGFRKPIFKFGLCPLLALQSSVWLGPSEAGFPRLSSGSSGLNAHLPSGSWLCSEGWYSVRTADGLWVLGIRETKVYMAPFCGVTGSACGFRWREFRVYLPEHLRPPVPHHQAHVDPWHERRVSRPAGDEWRLSPCVEGEPALDWLWVAAVDSQRAGQRWRPGHCSQEKRVVAGVDFAWAQQRSWSV